MAVFLLFIALPAIVVPLVCGILVLKHARRGGQAHPQCGGCGYDVSVTLRAGQMICPECGGSFADVGVLPAMRRIDRRAMIIGVALIASPALTCGNIAILAPVYNTYLRPSQRAAPSATPSRSTPAQVAPSTATAPTSALPSPEDLGETMPDR